jgi:methyl-accepting chemotaxis protein
MKNQSITVKFFSILGLLSIFILISTFYSMSQMDHIKNGFVGLLTGPVNSEIDISVANRGFVSSHQDIAQLLIELSEAGNKAASAALAQDLARFDEMMNTAIKLTPQNARQFANLKKNGDTLINQGCAKTISLAAAATTAQDNAVAQTEYLNNCSPGFKAIGDELINDRRMLGNATDTDTANLKKQVTKTIYNTVFIIITCLFIVGVGTFFAIRSWIILPLKTLMSNMNTLSQGKYDIDIFGLERKDEIGLMSRAVQQFKLAGIEKQRLAQEAEVASETIAAERAKAEAERMAASKKLEFVISSLAEGLDKLSNGELIFRIKVDFDGGYEQLRQDFNKAMETLQNTVEAIATNTLGVRSGASEITQASDDLSRRTEQQAASLEQTAAALDEITATVKKSAEGAQEARNLVANAKADAERSSDVLRETVTAMSGIETSSKQIGNIIGVIDEIAFQTNLLALNAGVEAARAGDTGRGFAVVATEVRALAQRSADAAKEIKSLISASGQQVDIGVRLVNETGNFLKRIVEQVAKLNGLISEIAASAQEQSTGLSQVNTAVNQMDQVTQQNAAMVEQSTAASHNLASEAEELTRLISQFKTGTELQLNEPASRRLPARPAGKSRNAVAAPIKFIPPATNAVRPKLGDTILAGTGENWDEF